MTELELELELGWDVPWPLRHSGVQPAMLYAAALSLFLPLPTPLAVDGH